MVPISVYYSFPIWAKTYAPISLGYETLLQFVSKVIRRMAADAEHTFRSVGSSIVNIMTPDCLEREIVEIFKRKRIWYKRKYIEYLHT